MLVFIHCWECQSWSSRIFILLWSLFLREILESHISYCEFFESEIFVSWWNDTIGEINQSKTLVICSYLLLNSSLMSFQATSSCTKCFLLSLSWSSKELCYVIYILFRSWRWYLSICLFISIYIYKTSKLSRSYWTTTIGLCSTSSIGLQCGKSYSIVDSLIVWIYCV